MSDGTVDLTPYLGDGPVTCGGVELGRLTSLRFTPSPPRPRPLDGPGYLVISRGEPMPGQPVLVGSMPDGIAGGVAEWTAGRIAEADGMAAPAEGEPGWYVPAGAVWCPRCGDQNWAEVTRLCITCTYGDDSYADGAFSAGWSAEAADRARLQRD
jgi:ribosomal protein L37E